MFFHCNWYSLYFHQWLIFDNSEVSKGSNAYRSILKELLRISYKCDQALLNGIASMRPFQQQKGLTMKIHPWNWGVNRGVGSKETAVYPKYCSMLYVDYFEFDNCSFIIVKVTVVRRRKDSYNSRKLFLSSPMIHLEAISLRLVRSNYWQ